MSDHVFNDGSGRVKKIHAGLAISTSRPSHRELTEELAQALERPLSENDGGALIGLPLVLG